MSPADLLVEAHRYESRLRGHLDHLAKLGVLTGLAKLAGKQPAAGLANVRHEPRGLWQPEDDGQLEMVIPVVVPDIIEPFGVPIETIQIIDIIAFSSRSPANWRWRTGMAWALGPELLTEPTGDPVPLVATPLAWLREGGAAACILDWSENSPAWRHLRAGPDLIASSFLRARLEAQLRKSIRLPRILEARDAAA